LKDPVPGTAVVVVVSETPDDEFRCGVVVGDAMVVVGMVTGLP
jgi:hypothetical protein